MTARRPERNAGAVARTAAALKLERELEEGRARRRGGRKRGSSKAALRLAEIQRLIRYRHGGPCDTDDGLIYLQAAMPCLFNDAGGPDAESYLEAVLRWRSAWAPLTREADALAIAEGIRRDALARRGIHLSADAAANLLCVSVEERAGAKLRTIGAKGQTKRQRALARRQRQAEQKRRKREEAGAVPRVSSQEAAKPWEAAGISRSTWFRRQAGDTVSAPIGMWSSVLAPKQSHSTGYPPLAGPARIGDASPNVGAGGPTPGDKAMPHPASRTVTLPLSGDEGRTIGGSHRKGHRPPKVVLSVREAMRSSSKTPEGTFPVQKLPRAVAPQSKNKTQTR